MAVVKIGSERSERPPILGTTTGEFSVFRQTLPLLSLAICPQQNSRAASRSPRFGVGSGNLYREFGCLVGGAVGASTAFLTSFLLSPPCCRRNETDETRLKPTNHEILPLHLTLKSAEKHPKSADFGCFDWLREPDLNRRSVDTKHLRCTLFAQTQVSATPFCSLFLPLAALANVPSGL